MGRGQKRVQINLPRPESGRVRSGCLSIFGGWFCRGNRANVGSRCRNLSVQGTGKAATLGHRRALPSLGVRRRRLRELRAGGGPGITRGGSARKSHSRSIAIPTCRSSPEEQRSGRRELRVLNYRARKHLAASLHLKFLPDADTIPALMPGDFAGIRGQPTHLFIPPVHAHPANRNGHRGGAHNRARRLLR